MFGRPGAGEGKENIRLPVEATDDTDDAEEDDGLKISLNVLLALGGEAVTAVRSSGSQSSMSVLISSEYFTSSLGGGEEEENREEKGKEEVKEKEEEKL